MLKTKIENIKNNVKDGFKTLAFGFGIPILIGVCLNYFGGGTVDYRDTTPNSVIESKKEIAEVTSAIAATANNAVKPPNYADCMNVANLKDRQYCLSEALKLKN